MPRKFGLDYLKPTKTVWHTLEGVHIPASNPKPVRLKLRPAGRCNGAFTSALIKAQKERAEETGAATPEAMDAGDERQAKIFAKHVVEDWDEVRGEDGAPLKFSAADCEALLVEIAVEQQRSDLVNKAYVVAFSLDNFAKGAEAAAALGKA